MEKQLYWLIESNGDLSITVDDIKDIQHIIANDVVFEFDLGVEDLQYTITPKMLTMAEFEALGEQN